MVSGLRVNNKQAQLHDGRFSFWSGMIGQIAVPQPSIEEKGITTIRLHRLHFSSKPCPHTLAINCPHAQRVSRVEQDSREEVFATAMVFSAPLLVKLRTIINIPISGGMSSLATN